MSTQNQAGSSKIDQMVIRKLKKENRTVSMPTNTEDQLGRNLERGGINFEDYLRQKLEGIPNTTFEERLRRKLESKNKIKIQGHEI